MSTFSATRMVTLSFGTVLGVVITILLTYILLYKTIPRNKQAYYAYVTSKLISLLSTWVVLLIVFTPFGNSIIYDRFGILWIFYLILHISYLAVRFTRLRHSAVVVLKAATFFVLVAAYWSITTMNNKKPSVRVSRGALTALMLNFGYYECFLKDYAVF